MRAPCDTDTVSARIACRTLTIFSMISPLSLLPLLLVSCSSGQDTDGIYWGSYTANYGGDQPQQPVQSAWQPKQPAQAAWQPQSLPRSQPVVNSHPVARPQSVARPQPAVGAQVSVAGGAYEHDSTGDGGYAYVHDTRGDHGPYKAWLTKRKQQGLTAQPIIQQARPAVQQARPVVQQARPIVQQPRPVVQQARPIVQQPRPVVQQARPVVQQARPVVQQFSGPVQAAAPAFQESSQPVTHNPLRYVGHTNEFVDYVNRFGIRAYDYAAPTYSAQAEGNSYTYSASF